jgi:sugar phosphate isomerase/epimerase
MAYVDDGVIERIAKAIRAEYVNTERPNRPNWDNTPEHRKVKWRRMAIAALKEIDPEAESNG